MRSKNQTQVFFSGDQLRLPENTLDVFCIIFRKAVVDVQPRTTLLYRKNRKKRFAAARAGKACYFNCGIQNCQTTVEVVDWNVLTSLDALKNYVGSQTYESGKDRSPFLLEQFQFSDPFQQRPV